MSEELNNQPQNNEVTNPAENNDANTQTEADKNLENTTVETKETEKTNDYSDVNTAEQASAVLESKGFDYEALTEEFQANGDLLPETRTKLAAQGISGEILDTYIEGQKAIIQRHMEDISTVVGGMEQMAAVVEWAKNNLSAEEKK